MTTSPTTPSSEPSRSRDQDALPATSAEVQAPNNTASSPTPHRSAGKSTQALPKPLASLVHALLVPLRYTPPSCRYDPSHPPTFSFRLNILFAFAAGFTVANLYYSHPILNILAHDFGVEYEKVAQIPTVMQAGYAAGLLFLCPLGDLLRRRGLVVGLVGVTGLLWLVLCITSDLGTFTAISFLVSITTVTPQLMLPLVGDLAPPHRRAAALSIVVSGLMLGILIARVLSGTLTNFTTWRSIYWLSLALQSLIFLLLYLFMPDYPPTSPGLSYFRLLWSILQMLPRHPVLVQACLASFFTSATFTSFWTTLTFLLAAPPYQYSSLAIGLFGLIGIAPMLLGPLYARTVTDRFVPHLSVLVGLSCCLAGICLGTYTGTFTIAGPVLQALLQDFGLQTAQIANRSAIYAVEPKRRNGVNTAFMVATFCGQLVGTAVGNHVYARAGWVGSGSASVGLVGAAIAVMVARGPWERRWVGWRGGWSVRRGMGSGGGGAEERGEGVGCRGEEVEGEGGREKGEERDISAREKVLAEVAAEAETKEGGGGGRC